MRKIFSFILGISILASTAITVMPNISAQASETDTTTTIIAASDFQATTHTAGQTNMRNILSAMATDGISSADGFLFCGDYDVDTYGDDAENEAGVKALLEVTQTVAPIENTILVQGNHDCAIGEYGMSLSGDNDPSNGAYGVYVINEDDYMWYNNNEEKIKFTSQALIDYLNEKIIEDYTKPIFVVSHLPLHYSMRTQVGGGDAKHANYIFDVLNAAGEKGLNIFFLFGHDHSNGWDDYLGGGSIYLTKGDSILIGQNSTTVFKEETLNFTYMNAGYVGYYGQHNSGVDGTLTMTSFTIDDDSVLIKRYDKNGVHNLKSAGVTNAYKNEDDYAPNTKVYESAQDVVLSDIVDTTLIQSKYGRSVDIISKEGEVDYTFEGENIILEIKPNDHWILTSLTVNGKEVVLSDFVNGKYTTGAKVLNTIQATYEQEGKYKLTIDNDSMQGTVKKNVNAFDYYVGQALVLTVEAKEGYTLSKVTFNGVELTPNSNGKYDITIVEGENVFKTEYTAVVGSDSSVDSSSSSESSGSVTTDPGSSGCGSSIGLGITVGVLPIVAVLFIKKRKEN